MELAIPFARVALLTAAVLVFVRLVWGPTVSDRVVALDTLSFLAVGLIAVHAAETGSAAFLDGAVLLALIAFLGTVAWARYVELAPAAGEEDR